MNRLNAYLCVGMLVCLSGCAELNTASKELADGVAPHDTITGQRSLNLESQDAEIKRAAQQTKEILSEEQKKGVQVDTDQATLTRLQNMMQKLSAISHRPQLPWEIHLIESPEVNAFTVGGGKIFVYRGLFGGLIDPASDDELAAVLAHEIGHVVCKHIGKRQGVQFAAMISKRARESTENRLYQASFTTLQEDEADRVGLLYMALAGYDPRAAEKVWERAHQKYGSNPGNYTYDHSLNIDRMKKVGTLTPIALKYYKSEGTLNADYEKIRIDNELIPKTGSFAGDNGLLALLEASLDIYSDHLKAKTEELSRETKQLQAQNNAMLTRINFQISDTRNGYRGIFGKFQNTGTHVINSAEITVYYVNSTGSVVYAQPVSLQYLSLYPGYVKDWSAYLLNVPGMQNIRVTVTKVDIPD